jgi:sensor domain CHASE-containing protein
MTGRIQKLQLTGAQEGLMLTVTPEDCLVHWSGTYPLNSNVQLVEEAITLPYQKGSTLRDASTPTKVLSSKASLVPGREAFMIWRPLPMPPTAPDVRSSDESKSNISPNMPEYDGESEGQ